MFVYAHWQSRLCAVRHVRRLSVALLASCSESGGIGSKSLSCLVCRRLLFSTNPQQPATADEKSATANYAKNAEKTEHQLSRSYLEEVFEAPPEPEPKTVAQKVKRGVEGGFYVTIILVAVAGFFVLFYLVMSESFGLDSASGAYNKSLDLIRKDARCISMFGEKVLGHGETSSRGRRRHVQSRESVVAGKPIRQIVFHVKGNGRTGRAYAEMVMDDGRWDYRLLAVVTTDSVVPEKVILIDRR